MCASGGVGTAMLFAKAQGADSFQIFQTANSADVSHDESRVVGYAAGVFLKSTQKKESPDFDIPEAVRHELLVLARNRIRTAVAGEMLDYTPPAELRARLETPAAVFVTLHKNRHLRGCIGTTTPRDPLWRAVHELAHSAAFRDPRFPPVSAEEVADLHIEISVLSPLQTVDNADAIVPHTHGVVVRQGYQCGLFLPQVWEQIPDKDQFLTILCQEKAHLPGNAWRDGSAELSVFTVCAFAEEN
jgi:AmmeMemoRadiSam system protein A